jgi:hypothetical protein
VVGITHGAGYGVAGVAAGANSTAAVFGRVDPPAGAGVYAGLFQGNVLIQGSYTATGAKSAAVPHPDGSHRRMYCQESPEPWFEDFGRAQLVTGRADVRLDRDFALLVRAEDYLVFLTPEGDCRGLYVSARSPTGFEVRELAGGTASLAFGYRVVAKRKDLPGPRLARVPMPERVELPARAAMQARPAPPAPRPRPEPPRPARGPEPGPLPVVTDPRPGS